MQRGEIWWGETATSRGRPYLVISRDAALALMTQVLVAPVTSSMRNIRSALRLGADDGMNRECIANFDDVRARRVAFLTRKLGALGEGRMHEICEAMSVAIGC